MRAALIKKRYQYGSVASGKQPPPSNWVEIKCEKQKVNKMEKNLPEKKIRAGAISATVWENQGKNNEGKPVAYKTVSFERSYKDSKGEWKTTSSLRMNDLPKAKLVLEKAFEYLALSNSPTITQETV